MRHYFLEETENPPEDAVGVRCLRLILLLAMGTVFLIEIIDSPNKDIAWPLGIAFFCFVSIKLVATDAEIEEGQLVTPFRRHTMLVGIAIAKSAKWFIVLILIAVAVYLVSGIQIDKMTLIIFLLIIIALQRSA